MLTERAVGPYSGRSPYALSPRYFEQLLSKPFENQIVELLRTHNYVAGEVTSKGTWITQNGSMQSPAGTGRPPGQIDVLAWRPTGSALIADCKVLQLPWDSNSLINLWKKLQGDDEEGFSRKVQANTKWCVAFLNSIGKPVADLTQALILDSPLHFWRQSGEVVLMDYESLSEKLGTAG